METFSFRWQDAMTFKDWLMTSVLILVACGLWLWVLNEYQKPIIDEDWVSARITQAPEPSRINPTTTIPD